jgi:hypothetical protein
MGKGGGEEVVKPVAQMRTSKSVWFVFWSGDDGDVVVKVVSEMEMMRSGMTVTLGCKRDSRNPGPGVRRRQPGGKVGMMWEMRSGRGERVADMAVRKRDWMKDCISVPRRVESWMRLPPSSKTLRKARKEAGFEAKALRCSGVTWWCWSGCVGKGKGV